MNKHLVTLTTLFALLLNSCSQNTRTQTQTKLQEVEVERIKELVITNTPLSELLRGQWKTNGKEGVLAHWREYDNSNNVFRTWYLDEPRPLNPSGTYEVIGDSLLQLLYSNDDEIVKLGFDSISQNYIEMLSFGVSDGNLIYKKEVLDAITFDKMKLTNATDTMFSIEIPKARDLWGKNQSVVDSINKGILTTFGISGFKERQSIEFRWGNVSSTYKIKKEILHLQIYATYYGGNYPKEYEYEYFYDLKSGKELQYSQMPFEALFTLSGYLDFLYKFWLAGAKEKFAAAESCAGSEPLCSYYDINDYTLYNDKLSISLTNSCFARVAQFCSPKYSISIEFDSIQTYLNKMGKSILSEPKNFSSDPFDKIIANQKLFKNSAMKDLCQNTHFIFGKIDDKYPISMALNIDTDGKISGHYYYDNKLQKLKLEGQKKDSVLLITETVNNQQTGFFELTYSNRYERNRSFVLPYPKGNYDYLTATWRNPENTKSFDIIFSEVKSIIKN